MGNIGFWSLLPYIQIPADSPSGFVFLIPNEAMESDDSLTWVVIWRDGYSRSQSTNNHHWIRLLHASSDQGFIQMPSGRLKNWQVVWHRSWFPIYLDRVIPHGLNSRVGSNHPSWFHKDNDGIRKGGSSSHMWTYGTTTSRSSMVPDSRDAQKCFLEDTGILWLQIEFRIFRQIDNWMPWLLMIVVQRNPSEATKVARDSHKADGPKKH